MTAALRTSSVAPVAVGFMLGVGGWDSTFKKADCAIIPASLMPLYSFRCQNEHIVEKLLLMKERASPGPCPECGGDLERVYLSRQENAQRFTPIVLDESPTGEFSYPMAPDAPVPPGFSRREIRTFAEADACLKRVNALERRKIEARIEMEHASLAENEGRNHSDLRQRMAQMSRAGRDFARYAMERVESRRPRTFEPNVVLEVREYDRSSRDPHEDRKTNWRERRS